LTRDVNPIGDPVPPGIFPRSAPVRTDNERQGSGGQGQGQPQEQEAEKETPLEEHLEETGHLEEDSFRTKRHGANLSQFMADKLPWEINEGARKNPLEQSRLRLPAAPQAPNPSLGSKQGTLGAPLEPLHRVSLAAEHANSLSAAPVQVPFPPRQFPPQPSSRGTKPLENVPPQAVIVPQTPKTPLYCACAYRVLDGVSGRPVAGVVLEFSPLSEGDGDHFSVQADVAGLFNSVRIQEGNYQVRAVLEGYEPQAQTRCLTPDEEDTGTFLIKRAV
jgi:hypothetical protein